MNLNMYKYNLHQYTKTDKYFLNPFDTASYLFVLLDICIFDVHSTYVQL